MTGSTDSPGDALRLASLDGLEPILLREVDIASPLPGFSFVDEASGREYRLARCLVRAYTRPLGIVELVRGQADLAPAEMADLIWDSLRAEITDYLEKNLLPAVQHLDSTGLPPGGLPKHLRAREEFLAAAPFISVVIGTRERPDNLRRCLQSFEKIEYPDYEIIVVDNAPMSGETFEVVSQCKAQLPNLKYVREDLPGLSRARNAGLAAARGEIVAITDDDVRPDPFWLTELAMGFNSSPKVGCVTGSIIPVELETPSQIWIEQFGGFSKGFRQQVFDLEENRPDHSLYPYAAGMFGSGANLGFKTSILRALGGFDPALGAGSLAMSAEEFKSFIQILSAGYQIVYAPGAIIYHTHHRDYESIKKQIHGYGVGLMAFLTSISVQPRHLLGIMVRIPRGVWFALSSQSPKNQKRQDNYPGELKRIELLGMIYGPLAYLRSRLKVNREARLSRSTKKAG